MIDFPKPWISELLISHAVCSREHEEHGPCTDVGICPRCHAPAAVMRPAGETYGLHADDCSLPERHFGPCVGGGTGHPVAPVVRGWWPGFEHDVQAARERKGCLS